MGTFVPVPADPPFDWGSNEYVGTGGDTTKALVVAKFDSAVSIAEDMLERLVGSDGESGYLGDLNSIITDFTVPVIDTLTITNPSLGTTPDTRPTPDIGSLDTDFPTFTASSPALTALPSIDLSAITPADLPDEISAAISWLEAAHDNPVYTDLITRIQADLISGATGLDSDVEQDIYDRAIARQDIEDAKEELDIEEYFAAKGFDLPTGALAGAKLEQSNNIRFNRTELNGKILEEQARLAQSNSQFIIGMAKDLEAILRDFTNKKNDRSLDYAKAVAANAIALYVANVQAYVAAAEANKMYVEVQVENLKAVVAFNQGLISQFASEAQAYGILIDGKAKKNKAITDIFDSEVKGYEAETNALSENQKILLGEYEAEIKANDLLLKTSIANADNVIRAFVAESSLREKVSADMANIAMQSVASANGMVNMSASLTHGTGRHQQESYGHTETRSMSYGKDANITETHTFQEPA